jgi:hypothetical protein
MKKTNAVQTLVMGVVLGGACVVGWMGLRERTPSSGSGIAWGALPLNASEVQPAKIATVDALAVIEALLAGERYKPLRDAYEAEQRAKLDKNVAEMDELQKRYAALPDNSDQRDVLAKDFQGKRDLQDRLLAEAEKFNTNQVVEAYRVTIETAESVATKMGYTHILSTRNDPKLIRSENVPGAIQEILARPVLRSPAADDITKGVMAELKVSTPADSK